MLKQVQPYWLPAPPNEVTPVPQAEMIEQIQSAIRTESSINILYHAPGRTPEPRHITPLLVEQRGPRHYLIAYCHDRRDNRTFRLDRVKLV